MAGNQPRSYPLNREEYPMNIQGLIRMDANGLFDGAFERSVAWSVIAATLKCGEAVTPPTSVISVFNANEMIDRLVACANGQGGDLNSSRLAWENHVKDTKRDISNDLRGYLDIISATAPSQRVAELSSAKSMREATAALGNLSAHVPENMRMRLINTLQLSFMCKDGRGPAPEEQPENVD